MRVENIEVSDSETERQREVKTQEDNGFHLVIREYCIKGVLYKRSFMMNARKTEARRKENFPRTDTCES